MTKPITAKWNTLRASARNVLLNELVEREALAAGETKCTLASAIVQLTTVAPKKDAPRDAKSYQQSLLRKRLDLPESRGAAIASVAATIVATGSIEAAARHLGISRRSLFRLLSSPDIKLAVDKAKAAST